MRARSFIAAVVILMLGGMLAGTAAADIHAVGGLVGQAEVGQWFTTPCDEFGGGTPQGSGVAPATGSQYSREGSWHLFTDLTAVGQNEGQPGAFLGTIEICGRLDREPVTRHGPVCGVSKGFGGQGRAFVFDQVLGGTVELRLSDVGWKEQAGSILPVMGNFARLDTFGDPTGDVGTVLALVAVGPSASDAAQCFGAVSGNGVKAFEVIAAFSLLSGPQVDWNDVTGYVLPKSGDDAKSCFANGPDDKAGPTPSSGPSYC